MITSITSALGADYLDIAFTQARATDAGQRKQAGRQALGKPPRLLGRRLRLAPALQWGSQGRGLQEIATRAFSMHAC